MFVACLLNSISYCCLAFPKKHQQSLPTSKHTKFICRHIYKLYGTINVTESGSKISPMTAYSLICESSYENLFCTETSDAHWQRSQWNITGCIIECPLFRSYKTSSKFFLWKITFSVKIGYKINYKECVTIDRPVTSYFKCPNIARTGPHELTQQSLLKY